MLLRVPKKKKKIYSARLHGNTGTFPSDVRRSATASTNALCSILHLYSGLLKSGLGHYMEKKKILLKLHMHLNLAVDVKEGMKLQEKTSHCHQICNSIVQYWPTFSFIFKEKD